MTVSRFLNQLPGFLILAGLSWPASAEIVITDQVHLECADAIENNQLQCRYRLVTPQTITRVDAYSGEQELSIAGQDSYPWENGRTAILFLVDTSDPAREPVVSKNRQDIEKILSSAGSHHQIGLASFDKGLKVHAPVGSSGREIVASLPALRATGKITELYRSILAAIDLMKNIDADRKSIFLFSDGLAEDKAYYHDDVVRAARESGIIITSLGFPRSISLSVGLQTIRRLSEETGGRYIESDINFRLPEQFLQNPFASIDNGGRFSLDMSPLLPAETQQATITLEIETTRESYQAAVQVPLPYQVTGISTIEETGARTPVAKEQTQTSRPVQIITRETQSPGPFNKWFWYGIPAALITLLLVTIGILLLSTYRQNRKQPARASSFNEFKPYAYLVMQDETKKRYPIIRTTWRIGRGKDNEMTLNDSSVSRRHAEIHRDKGDLFTIYDLDSLNGVYINNNKVSKSLLHEGDIIEIGDINLRFTLLSTDYSVEESTVMQNTRTPMTH